MSRLVWVILLGTFLFGRLPAAALSHMFAHETVASAQQVANSQSLYSRHGTASISQATHPVSRSLPGHARISDRGHGRGAINFREPEIRQTGAIRERHALWPQGADYAAALRGNATSSGNALARLSGGWLAARCLSPDAWFCRKPVSPRGPPAARAS